MNTYPIDFEALAKGQTLTAPEIVRALGVGPESEGWAFALMNLRAEIHLHREDLVCKVTTHGIVILSDSEASDHTQAQFERCRKGLYRSHKLAMRVNNDGLTPDEQHRHALRLTRQGAYLVAMRGVRMVTKEADRQALGSKGE